MFNVMTDHVFVTRPDLPEPDSWRYIGRGGGDEYVFREAGETDFSLRRRAVAAATPPRMIFHPDYFNEV